MRAGSIGTIAAVNPERRRILRLAALGSATLAGSGYLLLDRLSERRQGDTVAKTGRSTTTSTGGGGGTSTAPTSGPGSGPAVDDTSAPADPTTSEPSTGEPPTGEAATATVMLCREAWGAAAPNRAVPAHQIRGLMVHHTAVVLDDNRKAPDRIRGHQRYHQNNGFADIAYHVFIDANGNVYEGRDTAVAGETFTDYDPTGWFLVVCEGNFDEQPLPDAQRDALARVLAWAAATFGVAPDVASHRQHAQTRCPGGAIHGLVLDGTLARLTREMGPVDLPEMCGDEADSRIALIRSGAL